MFSFLPWTGNLTGWRAKVVPVLPVAMVPL